MFHDPYGYGYAQPPGFRQTYSPRQEQARQSGPDWMFVPCIRDAANVTVPPGGKAWIMAQDQPQFAVKSADSLGMTTTDYYRFERFDPEAGNAVLFLTGTAGMLCERRRTWTICGAHTSAFLRSA